MKPLLALFLLLITSPLQAQMIPTQRLVPTRKPTAAQDGAHYGESIATSDRYIAVAAKSEDIGSGTSLEQESGAVYLFSVSTGALVRRIPSPSPSFFAWFGSAVAVDNTRVYVAQSAKVFAFDIATGKRLWSYTEPTGAYGRSMALTGNDLLVGCPEAHFPGMNSAGKVLHLNALTGTLIQTYEPLVRRADAYFGSAVVASGKVMAASAPGYDRVLDSNKSEGLVQIRDLADSSVVTEIQEATAETGQKMGRVLSLQGRTLATTVRNGDEVWLYSLTNTLTHTVVPTGVNFMENLGMTLHGESLVVAPATAADPIKLIAPTTGVVQSYIWAPASVVVSGRNYLAIGNPDWQDSTSPYSTGAALIARSIPRSYASLTELAHTGDAAPVASPGKYASIAQQTYNAAGKASWSATLRGVSTATNKGTWNNISGSIDLALRKGDNLGGSLGTATDIVSLSGGFILARSGSTGTRSLWQDNGMTVSTLFQEGAPLDASGIVASKLLAVAGAVNPLIQVQGQTGTAGVTPGNDLMVAHYDTGSSKFIVLAREGGASGVAGRDLGQPFARLNLAFTRALIASSLTGDTATNQLLFYSYPNGVKTKIAQRGDAAPGTNGALYSQFLGEVNHVGFDNTLAMRASLSNSPPAENEAVFSTHKGSLGLVARKGAVVDGFITTARYSRFLRVCTPTVGSRDLLVHASFAGVGITPANNEGLFHYQGTGSARELLLRKGDPAPGCGPARIGSILRLELDPFTARYYVLATLVGAPAGAELALFQGNLGGTTRIGRSPFLVLRKGTPVFRNGRHTVIRSIAFSTQSTTAQGFPAIDVCRQISSNGLLILITYADNQKELVSGWPEGA